MLIAATLSGSASSCGVLALVVALSLSEASDIRNVSSPAAGSICTGLLVVCTFVAMVLEFRCFCKNITAHEEDRTGTDKCYKKGVGRCGKPRTHKCPDELRPSKVENKDD